MRSELDVNQLKRLEEYERYILEELPQDPKIRTVFQEAVEGKRGVVLVVKGARPMYKPHNTLRNFNVFWFNVFWYEAIKENYGEVPVPTICRLAGIDPNFVQYVYFNFRQSELERSPWPRPCGVDEEISKARKQVVTNLFPFPTIEWRRQNGIGGTYLLAKVWRGSPFLREAEIRQLCQSSEVIG